MPQRADSMQIRPVSLKGGKLIGELRQPKPGKRLIVICHGYKDSRANPTIVAVTKMLNRKGHATLTFNFSPTKGSIDIEQQVDDIIDITNHFTAYDDVILLASSFGALSASIATAHSSRITGLITISGFFGTGELGSAHRRNYLIFRVLALAHPGYRQVYRYIKRELQPELIKVPVLVVHSKADKFVSITQSQRFYAQLNGPKQFVALETATHGITAAKDRQFTVDQIHKWLRTTAPLRRQ